MQLGETEHPAEEWQMGEENRRLGETKRKRKRKI